MCTTYTRWLRFWAIHQEDTYEEDIIIVTETLPDNLCMNSAPGHRGDITDVITVGLANMNIPSITQGVGGGGGGYPMMHPLSF